MTATAERVVLRAAATAGESVALALRGRALARAIGQHLDGVTNAGADYAWGAAATGADNLGRFATFDAAAADAGLAITYVASELLDARTCDACADWDGHVFASMADADAQYPWGQNKDCHGRGRCRGMIFADYGGA